MALRKNLGDLVESFAIFISFDIFHVHQLFTHYTRVMYIHIGF